MSRSGYDDSYDNWRLIRYRGAVASAIRGKRGQAFLRELLAALDALPEKRLIGESFVADGGVCALGAVCAARGVEPPALDDDDYEDETEAGALAEEPADLLGISQALAAEVMHENDRWPRFARGPEAPEHRWTRMRAWVADQILPEVGK